jgi:hypothetical protein
MVRAHRGIASKPPEGQRLFRLCLDPAKDFSHPQQPPLAVGSGNPSRLRATIIVHCQPAVCRVHDLRPGKPSEGELDRGEGDEEWNLSTRVRFVSETGCAREIYSHRRPRDFD